MDEKTIGWAVKEMQNGERICRSGWNGKNMWLELQVPDANSKMTERYVYLNFGVGRRIPWNCSQADLLATDWQIVS